MARPPKYTDAEILDRAMDAFWRRGWSTTSIRELEVDLDVRAPAIYRRFGSKDGLEAAVLDHYVERVVRRRIGRHLPGDGDPVDELRRFFASGVVPGPDDAPLLGCLLTAIATEVRQLDPALASTLRRGLAEIEGAVHATTGRAATVGRLRPGLTADAAGSTLVLAWQGLMVLARGGHPSGDLLRRVDALLATVFVDAPST